MKKYVIVMILGSGKKYYISTQFEKSVNNLFGCCYILSNRKEARIFNTKKEAQLTLKDMNQHGLGRDAIIEIVNE